MGHHPQQPLLHTEPLDQRLVFLAQHQELVFELQLPLGAAAIALGGPQADAQTAHHLQLLPAGKPVAQLLQQGVAGEDLLGGGLKLDQCRGGHEPMQLEQLRALGRIGDLQACIEAKVLVFQKRHQSP